MSAIRILLCVEPDGAAAAEIRGALEPYGFLVEVIPEGERAIEWGKDNQPDLIIVSVEPRKVGYAVCNKIKRNATLRDVPLILTSAEETKEALDQHRKLKSHADEYLLKPLDMGELLGKVDQLVGLGEIQAPSSEIDLGDSDIVMEEATRIGADPTETDWQGGEIPSLPDEASAEEAVTFSTDEPSPLEATFDLETRAAFATLAAAGDEDDAGPVIAEPEADVIEFSQPEEAAPVFAPADADVTDGIEIGSSVPPEAFEVEPAYETAAANDDGISIEEPIEAAAKSPRPDRDDGVVAGLNARIRSLESERDKLRREVDEANARATDKQPFSKEKEFLNLREIINKKEKEILDLRDDLDAKERQILDGKDKVRELERGRRDVEEKSLGAEKSFIAANEKIAALSHDKEKSVERERGIKARLDDAQTEIRKAYEEVDLLKKRLAGADDKMRVEVDRLGSEADAKLRETESLHRRELAKAAEERASFEAQLQAEHGAELARRDEARKVEVDSLTRRFEDEQAGMTDRHQNEVARLKRDNEKAIQALNDELAVQLAADRHAHETVIENKDRDHRDELDQAIGRAKRAEVDLAMRAQTLDETARRLAGTEADLEAARKETSDRDAKIADYEDQIMRAFQRIRGDEKAVEKAKRALAVALTVLDERNGVSSGATASAGVDEPSSL